MRVRPTGIPTVLSGAPVCITIHAADPSALAALLLRHGIATHAAGDAPAVALAGGLLDLRAGDPMSLLVIEACDPVQASRREEPAARLMAVGFATVDHARFARQHGLGPLGEGPDDELLGARSWRPAAGDRLILLEPSTEGRLAAALARAGEGPLVVYLSLGGTIDEPEQRASALGVPGILLTLPVRFGAASIVIV